jgi:hypothetical protein
MDRTRVDGLTRSVSTMLSRRTLAGALGMGALALPGLTDAKKKHKHEKKHKVELNDFGCVDVGTFCKNDDQCCSGVCQGKKGKGTCQSHDQSTCQPGQDICAGTEVDCTTESGDRGECAITTGKSPYCETSGDCFNCAKDADCVPFCGEGAACTVCASCATEGTQTACVGTGTTLCTFF